MKTVLLTSGSGVFALGLARSFHAAGHRVVVADCWNKTLCRYSTAVDQYFQVPPPAIETEMWADAILRIAKEVEADVIVPVFEEALYLAEALEQRPHRPNVFAPAFETLITLHNKWLFNQYAQSLGLPVPQSQCVASRGELLDAFHENKNRVFKPVYSRWATHTVVKPRTPDELDDIEPSQRQPCVVQDFLPGRPFATYSVAHNGRMTAHATYASDMTTGYGPTYGYRPVRHPAVFEWVRTFVAESKYTGQIGLDFIEDASGNIFSIECNPRSTGALFLLNNDPRFPNAFLNQEHELLEPATMRPCITRVGMLGCLLRRAPTFPGWTVWAHTFFTGRTIRIFQFRDPLPALTLPATVGTFLLRCIKERKDARTLATVEREWSADRATPLLAAESITPVSDSLARRA